ncbi:MAG: winged helix-turn-helix domain-containing protein [Candidatus Heimdallarchaeota archaeon]
MIEISQEQAQNFILEKQGLRTKSPSKSIMDVVRRIHNIQIDTISVVARSHDLTLFNRLPNYQEKEVWKYIKDRKLFEYWSHARCLIPIEDYSFYAWKMEYLEDNISNWWNKWVVGNKQMINDVYKYIKKNGTACSADFKREEGKESQGWWDWTDEKRAMEYLFRIGKLMIDYRKGFQRYYDLTERVLPPSIDNEPMVKDELPYFMVNTIFSSIGLGNFEEMRFYLGASHVKFLWNNKREKITQFLDECIKEGILESVQVEGIDSIHFVLSKEANKLVNESDDLSKQPLKFLSPFDNLIRERNYPSKIWKFDYKLEAFTPEKQRIYGYYVLPILDNNKLIGRADIKAHRKDCLLEIKALYLEDKPIDDSFIDRFHSGLKLFADFHNCNSLKINRISPASLKNRIPQSLDD